MEPNPSFSTENPALQLYWDSTSIGAFKVCPRFYHYTIIEGWTPRHESVHLKFGLLYHAALERFDHAKSNGATHDEAVIVAARYCLEATWDRERKRPWMSDDQYKNRWTLIRTVVWYAETFKDDPLETVQLADGKPAVELSFRMDLPFRASTTGEHFTLCGHMDRVAKLGDSAYVLDRKTTKSTLGDSFFEKFTPYNQFTVYTLASKVVWGIPASGLIVDAAQIAVTFSRFQRSAPIPRPESVVDEWLGDLGLMLGEAEVAATTGHWRQNDTACDRFGGCPFRAVCSKAPSLREKWLEAMFTKRQWNPLEIRGDV